MDREIPGDCASPRLLPLGDTAWTVEFGDVVEPLVHARVLGLANALDGARETSLPEFAEIVDVTPTFRSLTVHYDPLRTDGVRLGEALLRLAAGAGSGEAAGRNWRIPVCFDDDFAPDLAGLAQAKGMSRDAVISLLTKTAFRVYMIGFMPGFPYMGGLPAALEMPRLATPRQAVPARSLAGRRSRRLRSDRGAGAERRFRSRVVSPARWSVMTQGFLEVVDGGFGNSIQDQGRFGFRRMGVAVSGFLDPYTARCANALVGNGPASACVEIRVLGPTLRLAHGRLRVALAGKVGTTLSRSDGGVEILPAWRSVTLAAGDALKITSVDGGTAYLAVAGGLDTPLQLGSRSTYLRAMIGGIDGRLLAKGQRLPVGLRAADDGTDSTAEPWTYGDEAIRVMLGPQALHFQPESVERFLASGYRVTARMDRMGARLEGAPLDHLTRRHADIVSDGVTPGAIQVPADGQPIVLLADCQTVGGYPKIATVVSADLPCFGQMRAGQSVRFRAVDAAETRQARLDREARWLTWAGRIQTVGRLEPSLGSSGKIIQGNA